MLQNELERRVQIDSKSIVELEKDTRNYYNWK